MGDATLSVVCRANSSCDAVVELEVFQEVRIRVKDTLRHTCVCGYTVYDAAAKLIEELRDISNASTELRVVKLVVLESYRAICQASVAPNSGTPAYISSVFHSLIQGAMCRSLKDPHSRYRGEVMVSGR